MRPFIKSAYIDWTKNKLIVVKYHLKLSGFLERLTPTNISTTFSNDVHLSPLKSCPKPMFSGDGYWSDKVVSPNQETQNRVLNPSPMRTSLDWKTIFSIPWVPSKKESLWAWLILEIECKYWLCSNFCHTPSSLISLNNKHLFLISNTSIPKPLIFWTAYKIWASDFESNILATLMLSP